ncbi:MAG: apolipoprotein N-acyltransferase, partial [Acidimicrobiales bacterium]
PGIAAGTVAAVLVAAAGAAGAAAPGGGPAVGSVAVAAVQGGGRRGLSKAEVSPSSVFDAQLAATGRLLPRRRARLVLWPEDVVSVRAPLPGTPQAAILSSLARRLAATVVAGVTATVSSTAFRNEAVAWGPGGRVVATYEKVHRVPFGEYVPYRSFFAHLANLAEVPLDAVAGHGTGLMRTPAAPLGVMLSYEVFFSGRGRSAVRAGARLLVVPTNTSSYAGDQVPAQEVAADRVQAVEEGRDLVQAAPTGYSSVVDAGGAVLRQSDLGARQVLVASVALRTGRTVYERFGDLPVLVLVAALVAAGWAAAGRRRQHRRHRAPGPGSPPQGS